MTRLAVAQMLESDGPGGAELLLVRLSVALRDRGLSVCPVGPARGVGWLSERLAEEGFPQRTFTLRRPIDWQCVRGMVDMLRAEHVDVIHSHEFTMAVYGAAVARMLGVPHVITMHGSATMTKALRRRVALRWAFRQSAAVVGVSDETTRQLGEALGLRDGVVRTVHNGVPAPVGDRARVRAELGAADDDILLLAVGSLVPRKGHAVLLDALAAMPSAVSRWRLVIAGQGVERPRLEEQVRALGLTHRVHLVGQRLDIADWYVGSDVFVMPSLWEGLPLALLEAMFAGSAIVASRTSGIPEAIDDGVEGLLLPPGDVAALSKVLARVICDGDVRAQLGAAARARAARQFSIARMADDYVALYREALGR
jgi:glycosyltransferase involved in cell wall biosynthesis